ncbi:MAG TPA: hypothetical protein VJ323_23190, partial [Bryobacteraceae bacterium]|nr:hypothetical protein [Bryobacteraceae bacterium]
MGLSSHFKPTLAQQRGHWQALSRTGFGPATQHARERRSHAAGPKRVLELPFKVDSVSKAAAPGGAEGVWHSYVISQGAITGERSHCARYKPEDVD